MFKKRKKIKLKVPVLIKRYQWLRSAKVSRKDSFKNTFNW